MSNVGRTFKKSYTWTQESNTGWLDYAEGMPYPKAYDGWSIAAQRNYEKGRLRAANYKLAFDTLPYKQVTAAQQIAAIKKVGEPVPPDTQPQGLI